MEQADIPLSAASADTLWLWEEDGGCKDGIPRSLCPHFSPPAWRMLPSQLSFLFHHPMNWLQGEAWKLGQLMAQGWEQPMAWEGKAQTPLAGATPSQSSGHKHTSEHRNHQEKTALRKAHVFSIKSLPLRNTRPGFCVCPNLALSLWKGLFVKCFVLMSLALISPCQPPALRIPLHSQVRCSIPPSHVAGTQRLRPFTTDIQGAPKCLKIFLLIRGALETCYIHMYFLLFFNLLLHQLLKKKKTQKEERKGAATS